jgi:hypothetical protein
VKAVVAIALVTVSVCACGGHDRHLTEPILVIRYAGGQGAALPLGQDMELPHPHGPHTCGFLSELEFVRGGTVRFLARPRPSAVTVTAAGASEQLGGGRVVRWRVRGPGGLLQLRADGRKYALCYLTDYSLASVRHELGSRVRVVHRYERNPRTVLRGLGYTVIVYDYAVDAREDAHGRVIRRGNIVISGPNREAPAKRLRSLD